MRNLDAKVAVVTGGRRPTKQLVTSAFDVVRTVGLTLPGVEATTKYDGSPVLKVDGIFLAGLATHPSAEPETLVVGLGGHLKSGQRGTPQNRPIETAGQIQLYSTSTFLAISFYFRIEESYTIHTWAGDKATQGCDLSIDPGAGMRGGNAAPAATILAQQR
jgi:hypothetical protein